MSENYIPYHLQTEYSCVYTEYLVGISPPPNQTTTHPATRLGMILGHGQITKIGRMFLPSLQCLLGVVEFGLTSSFRPRLHPLGFLSLLFPSSLYIGSNDSVMILVDDDPLTFIYPVDSAIRAVGAPHRTVGPLLRKMLSIPTWVSAQAQTLLS